MHASIHTLKSTTDGNDMMLKVWKVWSLMARILQYKSNKNTSRQRCTLDCECISLNFPHIFCVENAVSHDEECPVNFCIHITLIQQTQILTLQRIIHKRRNLNHFTFFSKFQHMNHHHHQFLNREGRWRTTDDFTTSFLFFPSWSPLPSGTWWTPGLSIPWCCLPTSSSVCLVFCPLSLCLARWFWPDLTNGRHDHITPVCVSFRWSGCSRVVRLPAGSWHGFLRW